VSPHRSLVIVESPHKAKTIAGFLGKDFVVESSIGHIRDLPRSAAEVPPSLKKAKWARLGVDVENGFKPLYIVAVDKRQQIQKLKDLLADAKELYLATDEDREGESIAWHLLEVLKPTVPVKRMVFHEITKDAIQRARDNTRDIDTALVDAQETRRILDRLYGFEVSPVLWRKVGPGLSAGRVQSAATRLVVERERERLGFRSAEYWDLVVTLDADGDRQSFTARLARLGGTRIATGRDFDDLGRLGDDVVLVDEAVAGQVAAALRAESTTVTVRSLETKPYTRRPAAPFTTSTLQQEAGRKLRFSARQTMSLAQSLYENGHITYMRTDSPTLSAQAIDAARAQARTLYGADSVPDAPRLYTGKAKGAQEAHEAIRPSGEVFTTPGELQGQLGAAEWKLYDLIWKRTVASQMVDAKGQTATVTLASSALSIAGSADAAAAGAIAAGDHVAELTASGTVITVRGFLAAYEESHDEDRGADAEPAEAKLPPLTEGEALAVADVATKQHDTQPPPRYTEASLVKSLEELGIGRPSTYASIISTIIDRGYVSLRGQALVPSWTAFSVVRLLEDHFGELVEYDFTADMEADLDRIAEGEQDRVDWLSEFYFGSDRHRGLRSVVDNLGEIDAREINSVRIADDLTLRIGKYGPYLSVVDPEAGPDAPPRTVNIPQDLAPDELTPQKARELADAPPVSERVLGVNPATGKRVVVKDGRFGPYVAEEDEPPAEPAEPVTAEPVTAEPGAKPKRAAKKAVEKPRTASLFRTMDVAQVDLETAIRLLDLPREVGVDPESGEPITAQNGRYGPYLKRGTDTRTLPSEDAIFEIDLAGALELYAQPKYGGRAASSALKEFEADPVSGKPIKLKDGRFGPYVTDGTTNATIPRGERVEDVDFARAVQLLADKRAKGPATPRAKSTAARSTKAPAKRATGGKSTASRTKGA